MKKALVIIGILFIIFSIILYISKSIFWFNTATIGVWLLFDTLSAARKNKTTADLITRKKYGKFVKLYFYLLAFGILIESIGSLLLGLWSYPKLWSLEPLSFLIIANVAGYLFYPFILMSFREMYNFLNSFIRNKITTAILSMIVGILIWEVPNVYSKDWIYKIPYINVEIFHINILVIIGWVILIMGSLKFYKIAGN